VRSSPAEAERLFLAVMPDVQIQQKILKLVNGLSFPKPCRKMPTAQVHVTLLFIGGFPIIDRNDLIERLKQVKCASFVLVFDRLRFRKRQQMLWLESGVPDELNELVAVLKEVVSSFGVSIEERPFRSHMTLARRLARFSTRQLEFEPLQWDVCEFALVRSRTLASGAEYDVLERFQLSKRDDGIDRCEV
jgi:2'-5' RNA ligase